MAKKEHLATITILVKDREANVARLNKLLTDNGNLIRARLGVNIDPYCMKECPGLITIVVKALSIKEMRDFAKKINLLRGILAKISVMS